MDTFVYDIPMPKGQYLAELELYVISALHRLGDDAYGVTIRREIEERTGRPVAMGVIYATLARLHHKGFVSFRVSEPRPVQGGRARKFALLTPRGRQALHTSTAMLLRILPALAGPGRHDR
jgi:PadR family transcriptional regulator PadR